jgi:hypothetical protein
MSKELRIPFKAPEQEAEAKQKAIITASDLRNFIIFLRVVCIVFPTHGGGWDTNTTESVFSFIPRNGLIKPAIYQGFVFASHPTRRVRPAVFVSVISIARWREF